MSLSGTAFPIERSNYFQFWLREREEITKHKWVLSEQAGRDVGYGYAQWNWLQCHRAKWLEALRASGEKTY